MDRYKLTPLITESDSWTKGAQALEVEKMFYPTSVENLFWIVFFLFTSICFQFDYMYCNRYCNDNK